MLIRSIEELKAALGSTNQNVEFETLGSFIDQAELRYLQPALGDIFLQELNDALDAREAGEAELSGPQTALLKHLRRSLAYYTMLEASPFLGVSFNEMGLQEQNADHSAPARQWVANKFENSAASNGDTLLDTALFWLESKASEFPTWRESEAYTVSKELFFHSIYDLAKFANVGQSRRTFLALRPFIQRVEELEILPLIGQERFDALKEAILTPGTLTAADKTLWAAIKPALAHRVVEEALPELSVQITSNGLRVLSDNDGIRERQAASLTQIEPVRRNAARLATAYLEKLAQHVDALNAAEQPTVVLPKKAYSLPDNSDSKCFRV
ncbi:MAG TPA: DUF6712 family protein [Hymenobacter sp.]|jgi:hypothetical protein